MNECYIDKNKNVHISEWYRANGVMVRRDALPSEHKESFLSCLVRLKLNPRDYGFEDTRDNCPFCNGSGKKRVEEF